MIYLPIKYIKYFPKSELRLPEEHRNLISSLRTLQETTKPKDVNITNIKSNPFYKELMKTDIAQNSSLPKTILRLTSIIQTPEKKVCIINDKPYYIGSVVEGYKIYNIGDYYVELKGPKGKIKLEVGGSFAF